jgi:alginate O-acetyltransferase complex protein AlgI
MSFSSAIFLVFLLLVVVINYYLPAKARPLFLLIASFVFVCFHSLGSALALIFFSGFNFLVAKRLVSGGAQLPTSDFRLPTFICALSLNIIAILLFNYFSLTPAGLHFLVSAVSFDVNSFILALGLSFYTLQNISYLIEVYKSRMRPVNRPVDYFLYCAFFPRIISGPILMPKDFFPQLDNLSISKEDLISGSQRMLLGFLKKMVIADRLAPAVASVFDHTDNYHGLTTSTAAWLFTIQLYFDFSAYSDMALGMAKLLGFRLKENFDLPLRSTSVSEFWRRWHISLISWFTTYLYYPIVYRWRAHKKSGVIAGIACTFIISGIWHGIGLTFLAWALCHVIYLGWEVLTKQWRTRMSEKGNVFLYKIVSVLIVFNLVCFSNIFFRSGSIQTAFRLVRNSFSRFWPADWLGDFIAPLAVGGHQLEEFNFFISILLMLIFLIFERKINRIARAEKYNIAFVTASVLLIMLFGIFDAGTRFIYMQF